MTFIYKINGLDCANCANELEHKLSKIEGINSLTLNFMSGKLIVDTENISLLSVIEEKTKSFEDGITLFRIK